MSKIDRKLKKSAGMLAVLACGFAVLAAPTPASAVDASWRIIGSLWDTDELAEAFGGGFRVGFPLKENLEFDISVYYYEDFLDRFENDTEDRIGIELSTIPADFGITWTKNGDEGFQFGVGLSWVYQDINDLEVFGINLPVTGDAGDEFGGYGKLGYQWGGGFFVEVMYRLIDVSVKNVTIGGIPAPNFNTDLNGYTINLGYRF